MSNDSVRLRSDLIEDLNRCKSSEAQCPSGP